MRAQLDVRRLCGRRGSFAARGSLSVRDPPSPIAPSPRGVPASRSRSAGAVESGGTSYSHFRYGDGFGPDATSLADSTGSGEMISSDAHVISALSEAQDEPADLPGHPSEGRAYGRILAITLGLAALLLVVVRMGASLIGLRVFVGLDLLYLFAPFSSLPGAHPLTSSLHVSDQMDATLPALHEAAQRFLHGDIAGWSSLVGGGAPLLATPDFSLLTPGRWLFLILPAWLAPVWAKLLEMAFAAIFSYLLVRRLNGSKIAAGLAGFVYPLTGFMIGWTNWPHVTVAAIIPMLFWSIERFVQERRIRSAVPVALATALLLFGGFPAVAGQALYFGGGYALVRLISEHRRRLRALARDIALLMGALALGIGLTAIQLLPFAQRTLSNVDLSYREGGFFVHDSYVYLLNTVFPDSFSGNQLGSGASPMDLNAYIGSVVLLLGVLGLFHALSGRIRGTAGLYFIGMILFIVGVLWFQGAWSNWIDRLPLFHGNPINRIRSQLALPVVVLAAAGFDLLRGTRMPRGWWNWSSEAARRPALAVAAAVTAVLVVLGIRISSPDMIGLARHRRPDVLLAIVPLVLILVLLLAALRLRIARLLALVVVLFSISAQALAATSFYWPTGSRAQFYPSTAGIRYLQQNLGDDRMATLGYAIRPNVTEYYGLRVLNGHAFFPKDLHRLITAIDPPAFVGNTYSAFNPAVAKVINSPGLGRMGVRYMVGEANTLVPSSPDSALFILGSPDPTAAAAGTAPMPPGTEMSTTVAGGSLRAVNVPVTTTAPTSSITVTLKASDGTVIASNKRSISTGADLLPIPLAADPAPGTGSTRSGRLTVEISADTPGVTVETDAAGRPLVQPVRPSAADNRVRVAFAGENLVVYERLDYVPRIHWASRATVITDPNTRLNAVTTSPLDRNAVILDASPPAPLAANTAAPQQFTVEEDSGDTVRVHVDTASAGYLVVADSVHGDFDATVDGHRRDVVSADYAVGAVYVPAGDHEIALHYDPPGRSSGTRITALSAVVLIVAAVPPLWWRKLRRRGNREV